MEANNSFNSGNGYSKEEWAYKKKKEREMAYGMIEKGLNDVKSNMSNLIKFLQIQAKFDLYSVNNCVLIMQQMPNAIQFKEMSAWHNDGYVVKRRDKGFVILEPSESYIDEDGNSKVFYNPKRVYDVTITNAPNNIEQLSYTEESLLRALLKSCMIKIESTDKLDNSNKCAKYDIDLNKMFICRGQEHQNIIQDLVEEMAKAEFLIDEEESNIVDFKSICVSYMYCSKYGIEFPKEQFQKLENMFKDMSKDELKRQLNSIRDTFYNINSRMVVKLNKEIKSKEQTR